ncbi:hypothetical protein BDR26DRAFT_931043 [Obelidium mucronatum]|nr:hypothetical protein BDR26DRAFT_931043 [Obelidium mucronatum]
MHTSATLSLRGRVFALHVSVVPNEALSVVLSLEENSDKTWRGTFSCQYVEEVTKKTGNFKRFNVFVEMLLSCLEPERINSPVSLDLISAADLSNNKSSNQLNSKADITSHERVYLVLTYATAFDRVHYPLPLQLAQLYSQPNTSQMYPQQTQSHYTQQAPQVTPIPPPAPAVPPLPQDTPTTSNNNQAHFASASVVSPSIQELDLLRQKIHSLKEEKITHMEEITRLLKENDKLKHVVKHYKSQHEQNLHDRERNTLSVEKMPELFKTVLKSISTAPHGSDVFKKSVKTLQRLVARLLESVDDDIVREAIRTTTATTRKPSTYKSPSNVPPRSKKADKSTHRDHTPTTASYKPLKSRPLGLPTSSSPQDSPRNGSGSGVPSRVHSRSASVNSTGSQYRRFDPTSYVLEKELKLLAKRQQSRESLNASMNSNSTSRHVGHVSRNGSVTGIRGVDYSRSSSVSSAHRSFGGSKSGGGGLVGVGKANRETSVESRRSVAGSNHPSGAARENTKINGREGSYKVEGGKKKPAAKKASGRDGWAQESRETEEDIDKRLEFLQQYLNTLNSS